MSSEPIVIIGAGMGGLALALRLAHRGEKVLVLEQTDQIGGRNRRLQVGEAVFDSGPSLLMMLDPFETLYRDVGDDLYQRLDVRLCDPSYRVFYRDGTQIEGTANVAKMVRQLKALGLESDAERFPVFLGELADLYNASIPLFVRKNYYSPLDFALPHHLYAVTRHKMLSNLKKRVDHWFTDPRLRMLFSFQTMYLGLSPFEAPYVYATLTYMEFGQGIWYPMGGLSRIADDIAEMAMDRGAEIRLNCEVKSIDKSSVSLESGETIRAKAVVSNADLPYAERALLNRSAKKRRYSCSAFMMYIDYRGELPAFEHHNVVFGADFQQNLDDIFHKNELPKDPAFYICASSKTDPSMAAIGGTNLMILVPCPNLDRNFSAADATYLQQKVFSRLCEEGEFDPDKIAAMETFGPHEWSSRYNLDKGAAFGLSHDFLQSAFFRPSNKGKAGTYFVGASTVPGNGLPMVLISAELAEQRLEREGVLGRTGRRPA
jgi:phytoene desaturase